MSSSGFVLHQTSRNDTEDRAGRGAPRWAPSRGDALALLRLQAERAGAASRSFIRRDAARLGAALEAIRLEDVELTRVLAGTYRAPAAVEDLKALSVSLRKAVAAEQRVMCAGELHPDTVGSHALLADTHEALALWAATLAGSLESVDKPLATAKSHRADCEARRAARLQIRQVCTQGIREASDPVALAAWLEHCRHLGDLFERLNRTSRRLWRTVLKNA